LNTLEYQGGSRYYHSIKNWVFVGTDEKAPRKECIVPQKGHMGKGLTMVKANLFSCVFAVSTAIANKSTTYD
jgi:hypothetical protein